MSQRRVRSTSPISGLPFNRQDTPKSLNAVCASSAPSRPKATTSLASTNTTAPSLAYGPSNVLSLLHLIYSPSLSRSDRIQATDPSPQANGVLLEPPREVFRVNAPTSTEPHYGRGINRSSRVPEPPSPMLSQNLSGIPRVFKTSSAMPSGQPETSQLQVESLVNTRKDGIDQLRGETLLERTVPQKGPMIGGIEINLWGQNFPAVPLYVHFGDNWAGAVSYARYHYPI